MHLKRNEAVLRRKSYETLEYHIWSMSSKESDKEAETSSTHASPIPCPTPSLLLSNEKQGELRELVQCPGCTYILSPPIHGCWNGHQICSTCRERFSECPDPECSAEFIENLRVHFVEQLVSLLTIPCEYSGCKTVIPGDHHRQHIENCGFRWTYYTRYESIFKLIITHSSIPTRPVTCNLETELRCHEKLINFVDYKSHLMNYHKISGGDYRNCAINLVLIEKWSEHLTDSKTNHCRRTYIFLF